MYKVHVLRRTIKDLTRLPKEYARLIGQHIERLETNPRSPDAKKLRSRTDDSLRVGTYRILYDIDDNDQTVTVYRIKHRRDAYR